MAYPASTDSFTTKTNKVDLVDAAHMNAVQTSIVNTQTELGTDVAGNLTDLKTRLANMMDGNGALAQGTSFPVITYSGMIYFRTDLGTVYLRNAANSAWGVLTGASNIQIFTSSDTFVAPSGISRVYVTCVGGGGGAGGSGGGGAGGSNGGATSFDSVISANGGTGGGDQNGNPGGSCAGGTVPSLNGTTSTAGSFGLRIAGGNGSQLGAGGGSFAGAGGAISAGTGGYGGGGGGTAGVGGSGGGGGGAAIVMYPYPVTAGNSYTVTIGAGGASGGGGGAAGTAGICIVMY